jgi:hypothetical protein
MPFTFQDALTDLAPAVQLADVVQKLIAALPPAASRKPSDYMNLAAGILAAAAPLADAVDTQYKTA